MPKLHSKSEPKVAVLVLNYNGKNHLAECLQSLLILDYENYKVYVVDNGSADGSVKYANELFPWVEVIAFEKNLGFAKAYNEAIKKVDADLVALLNNDTKVDRKWLQELVNAILEDKLIAAVGSKILLYDNPQLLNHAGAKITLIGGGFDIGLYRQDANEYNMKKPVGAVCGAAMLVKKDVFLEMGGFDDDFFAYFEDTDFCWRAWLYGYKVIYVPTSVVYHKLGGSWGRSSPQKVFLGEKNRLSSMIKNVEWVNLIIGLFLTICFNMIRTIIYSRNRAHNMVLSVIKADLWISKNIPKIMNKRILQKKRVVKRDHTLFELGVIASVGESIREFFRLNFTKTQS